MFNAIETHANSAGDLSAAVQRAFSAARCACLVPYFHELGISHIYASPLFKAAPHSVHGYDVCDFSQLNPELGTETDLQKLVEALHEFDMGLILDIVPNHMGIATPENVVAGCSEERPRKPVRELF